LSKRPVAYTSPPQHHCNGAWMYCT